MTGISFKGFKGIWMGRTVRTGIMSQRWVLSGRGEVDEVVGAGVVGEEMNPWRDECPRAWMTPSVLDD